MSAPLDDRLFFVIGAPRSGTTLLMRMLNVHPEIHTRPEPHLLTPLAHLGYYAHVQKAPYDPFQAALAAKEWVAEMGGEAAYNQALRAYTDAIYGKLLEPSGKRYFLDKTPAYALSLPFISGLYPRGKYVVLTRHPFAIFASFAESFFDGDWEAAHRFNPLLERYVPAIAAFLRSETPHYHVRYEKLVAAPELELQAMCARIGLPYDPAMIDYGEKEVEGKGLGDPIGVNQDKRPNTKSVDKWARDVVGNPRKLELLDLMVRRIDDRDLETWGFSRESLWDPIRAAEGKPPRDPKPRVWDRYHVERRLLLHLRRNIHGSALGKTIEKVRFACDVLLRE